jgi:hypothetical protein
MASLTSSEAKEFESREKNTKRTIMLIIYTFAFTTDNFLTWVIISLLFEIFLIYYTMIIKIYSKIL